MEAKRRTSLIGSSETFQRSPQRNRFLLVLARDGESVLGFLRSSCDLNCEKCYFRATGFLTMKVGKVVAVVAGGSIILLQIAANEGNS